jgi:uncharacterized protein (DUF2062 family)
LSGIWRRSRTFVYRRILHADDSPHALAMGVAIATFVALLPIMGVQTLVALAVAAVLRANKAVCVPIVWITNPFTAVPVYGGCLWVGRVILNGGAMVGPTAVVAELTPPPQYRGLAVFSHLFELNFWQQLLGTFAKLGAELWLGCAVVGFIAAFVLYFVSRWSITVYRERRRNRRMVRNVIRPRLPTPRPAPRGSA